MRDMKTVLAMVGVLCIGGGEAFCIFGPIHYQNTVHIVCHAILYSGIACVALAALAHIKGFRDKRQKNITDASAARMR